MKNSSVFASSIKDITLVKEESQSQTFNNHEPENKSYHSAVELETLAAENPTCSSKVESYVSDINEEFRNINNSATSPMTLKQSFQVVSTNENLTTLTDLDGAVYVLLRSDGCSVNNSNSEHLINIDPSEEIKGSLNVNSPSTLDIINSDGVPLSLTVSELLSSINTTKSSNALNHQRNSTYVSAYSRSNMLNLSSSILSTAEVDVNLNKGDKCRQVHLNVKNEIFVNKLPKWAELLQDCKLIGDMYTGYVLNEHEMDNVVNMYKKETQTLFSVRQTPPPPKTETNDTIRLMWKSHYVPFDGIPFVNIGRRATVYECEHGPRKRTSIVKRIVQMHDQNNSTKKIPTFTCPARLFVKKVRKFPQFKVPVDSDPKLLRQLQEHSLRHVRQSGFESGETRLYMHLPLTTSHRYHHIGNAVDTYQLSMQQENGLESLSVDRRVLEMLQILVRQGFKNPFVVRSALKDFVENKMKLESSENQPEHHDKSFYPPMIEIQNLIQQTDIALQSGLLSYLQPPTGSLITPSRNKKRSNLSNESSFKKVKVERDSDNCKAETKASITGTSETLSLTLTDNQLENFSVANLSYEQLAQLAKIGLLVLNNAAKESHYVESSECNDVLESSNLRDDSEVTKVK
ncbi:calcium-responsive transcription factor isoform X1 [Hydra vulgaris]|nr:calcium-responsive transcription factor-like [Hydra vulgaris]